MIRLVFTGPAKDANDEPITRADLTTACEKVGFMVLPRTPHDKNYMLVASRTDTVKAKNALAVGIKTIPYSELLATLKVLGAEVVKISKPDSWVDIVPKPQPQPAPEVEGFDVNKYGGDL